MEKCTRSASLFFLTFILLGHWTEVTAARNSFTVAPYFRSRMVLQRSVAVPVWGTATPGTSVTVSFKYQLGSQSKSVPTNASGKWIAWLDAMPAIGTPGGTMVISGGNTNVTFTDVLVGEVWVLSGQSNINVRLIDCDEGTQAVSDSGHYPNIRSYLIPQTGSPTETWEVSNPTNTPDWSGVGFFFARALYSQMTNPVPIGLIQVAKNGTPIADWTTYGGSNNGRLYQEKIKPLQPFAIRGVIWYQGEDDGGRESTALRYYQMLPGLIANWRTDWQQGNFPFFYVQLALISGRPNWAIVRDAQVATLDQTQSTAMACIIDIPTEPASEIHPKDKEPVGERLALAARALLYGEESLEYSGPIRDASKSFIQRNKIVVRFNHRGDGLFTLNNSAPGPFLLAGTDGVYYSATAQIVERTIIDNAGNPVIEPVVEVSSSFVPNPKSVRYCWGSYPLCNLFNNDGLPASPFQLPVSPLQLLEVP